MYKIIDRVIPAIASRHGEQAGGKYINSRETKLFHKSSQLYGLELAREAIRREGHVLVMEGYTDVVATNQSGIEPVVPGPTVVERRRCERADAPDFAMPYRTKVIFAGKTYSMFRFVLFSATHFIMSRKMPERFLQ